MPTNTPSAPVKKILDKLKNVKESKEGYTAHCPSHDDNQNSLSIGQGDDGKALVRCFAGCTTEDVLKRVGLELKDLFPEGAHPKLKLGAKAMASGLTLAELATSKALTEDLLKNLGCTDAVYQNRKAVRIPYVSTDGQVLAVRYRLGLNGDRRFVWRSGDKTALYGLDRLTAIKQAGWCLVVEGESDCWTLWSHDIPALGVPGKTNWRSDWRTYFEGLSVYLWQEPNAEDFTARITKDIPELRVIVAPDGIKDVSEAHLKGLNLPAWLDTLRALAVSAEELQQKAIAAKLSKLEQKAATVLAAQDPLEIVKAGIERLGFGGDIKAAIITYLAATSRLLAMRPGTMPVHLLLIGPASAGKSYTLQTVMRLMPEDAYHTIDAGSPRVLIYDSGDIRHKVIIFGEADSLPAGEDNPAASAIRNLLQEHRLHYKAVVKGEGGAYEVVNIDRPGPSVVITTSTRRLGEQLMTRLFILEVPDDFWQVRAALKAQATIELGNAGTASKELVAYQEYLQGLAPFDVVVPFADKLALFIGQTASASRILRDYSRLLSLVKAVTALRFKHRRTVNGRLVAELADYQSVFDCVGPMYEASVTGASQLVRDVVDAVSGLAGESKERITVRKVAERLNISKMAASRRIRTALAEGWLTNEEVRKGHPMNLKIGESLPSRTGLPTVEDIEDCNTVTPDTDGLSQGEGEASRRNGVTLETDELSQGASQCAGDRNTVTTQTDGLSQGEVIEVLI